MNSIFLFFIKGWLGTCLVILMAFAIRFFTRKSSKRLMRIVWLFVIARMLCPVSIASNFAVISGDIFNITAEQLTFERTNVNTGKADDSVLNQRGENIVEIKKQNLTAEKENGMNSVNDVSGEADVVQQENTRADSITDGKSRFAAPAGVTAAYDKSLMLKMITILSDIWMFGVCCLAIWSVISVYLLRKKCKTAEPVNAGQRIYQWKDDSDACVIGIVKPRIFLPKELTEQKRDMILLHEKTHMKRKDYIVAPLFYIALIIHWMNPLCWIAYNFFRTDTEMACDEETLSGRNSRFRQEYARVLLSLGTAGKNFGKSGMVMSFGSGDLKKRIVGIGEKKSMRKRQYASVLALICATMILASCNNSGVADTQKMGNENNTVNETSPVATEQVSDDFEENTTEQMTDNSAEKVSKESDKGILVNLAPDQDYTETMKKRGEEEIYNTWSDIIYADDEKVIVGANDGIFFVYDYIKNKVVRYLSLREYGINAGMEGDDDVVVVTVDKNCRYIYFKEWGMKYEEDGSAENVTFGKYRYDIEKNSFESYAFDENAVEAWPVEDADVGDEKLLSVARKTTDGIVYGMVFTNHTSEELWRHKMEQIVIEKDGKAIQYFPFEPEKEPEDYIFS